MNEAPTLGWSQFALDHSHREMGQSFTTLSHDEVVRRVRENWHLAKPGFGESTTDRKVVVPVSPINFYCPLRATLSEDLPIKARATRRQAGEDLYVETYVTEEDAKRCGVLVEIPASTAEVVCFSAEALTENNGERTTEDEWEIVTILCSEGGEQEPMHPLTMARNFLEKAGGTKTDYTAQALAESIYFHGTKPKGIKVLGRKALG